MKKAVSCLLLFVLTTFALSSCSLIAGAKLPGKNDGGETTLEFWIGDNVNDYDWSGHDEIYGWMGAREFLGKGYSKYYDEYYEAEIAPKYHVSYIVTSYPDYSSKDRCITEINITDPSVKVYGLTTESTVEEFDALFSALGYELYDSGMARTAEKDGVRFTLLPAYNEDVIAEISIHAEVTNKSGIVF